jgi:hypothetical protein
MPNCQIINASCTRPALIAELLAKWQLGNSIWFYVPIGSELGDHRRSEGKGLGPEHVEKAPRCA